MPLTIDTVYPGWLAALSVATFLIFGWDKLSALRRWTRIPERSLLLLILLGGFLGGWLGLVLFRHKRRKARFWAVLLLATLGHGYLIWTRWRGAGM